MIGRYSTASSYQTHNGFVNTKLARIVQCCTSTDPIDLPQQQHHPHDAFRPLSRPTESDADVAGQEHRPHGDTSLSPIAEAHSRELDGYDGDGDSDDADADDEQFDGLVTAGHWIAMDADSVYVCEELEVDPSNLVPMRCPPEPESVTATTDSWFIASAAPETD